MWSSRRTGQNTMPCRRQRRRIMRLFYSHEINYRRLLYYPPVCQMAAVYLPAAMRWCWMNVRKWRRGGCAKVPKCIGRFRHRYTKLMTSTEKILYIKCEKCAILDQIRVRLKPWLPQIQNGRRSRFNTIYHREEECIKWQSGQLELLAMRY